MKILVCIKRVPLTGGKMTIAADGRSLDTSHLGFTIGPHEECGVEEAVRLIEANGGESVVLTLGPADSVAQLRDAMALGVDRGIHLQADGEEWDAEATANAILEAIRTDEAASGPFDLIMFGNEAADTGGYQVGLRVAYALGRPAVRGAKGIAVSGGRARIEQATKTGRDVYDVPLPAVVTTLEGLNLPRYPSVPGRLRAKSKPVETLTPARPAPRLELVALAVPSGAKKQAELLGSGPASAGRVVEVMKELGVLS
jgi:electron transfer flavoprotein beta subunit